MKRQILSIAALLGTSLAQAQLAYPGYTWGTITFPNSVLKTSGKEQDNAAIDMKIEQGIDWRKFADGLWTINTYAHLRVVADNQGLEWNNKISPAIGVKLRRSFASGGTLDFGMQAVQERWWKSNSNSSGVQAYASWWFGCGGAKQTFAN